MTGAIEADEILIIFDF